MISEFLVFVRLAGRAICASAEPVTARELRNVIPGAVGWRVRIICVFVVAGGSTDDGQDLGGLSSEAA